MLKARLDLYQTSTLACFAKKGEKPTGRSALEPATCFSVNTWNAQAGKRAKNLSLRGTLIKAWRNIVDNPYAAG